MKRYIRSSDKGYKGFPSKDEYAKNTKRDEIQFDTEEVWSIHFYGDASKLISDSEIYILAHNYEEAKQQAAYLCKVWDYNLKDCTIQYAYETREWWNRHNIKLEGYVEYVEA